MTSDIADRLSEMAGGKDGTDVVDGKVVVWPSSTEDVAGILKAANETGFAVRCVGSDPHERTRNTAGDCPTVLIQRERLRGTWEYVREDLLLSVGAGVLLGEISSFLESDDLIWPGTTGYGDGEQIASVLDSAPGQGTANGRRIRRFLYGMIVVLPTGEIARLGARTVKSVAGYDLKALYVGSRSCFGIITECDLKLASRKEVLIEAPDYSEIPGGGFTDSGTGAEHAEVDSVDAFESGSADSHQMMDVLGDLKKKLDPNGVLPGIESVGLVEGCS